MGGGIKSKRVEDGRGYPSVFSIRYIFLFKNLLFVTISVIFCHVFSSVSFVITLNI
jgi:hypothetical protein